METATSEAQNARRLPVTVARAVLLALWTAIRLPIVTLLVILEPFVTLILMGIATLGVLMCLFNRFVLHEPHFPFWLMLVISLGSALLLLPYYGLIRLLAGTNR